MPGEVWQLILYGVVLVLIGLLAARNALLGRRLRRYHIQRRTVTATPDTTTYTDADYLPATPPAAYEWATWPEIQPGLVVTPPTPPAPLPPITGSAPVVAAAPVQAAPSLPPVRFDTWPNMPQDEWAHIAHSPDLPFALKYLMWSLHIMIIGETGSGKTELARAIVRLRSWLGHQVAVFDCNATLDRWGMPAIGAGNSFSAQAQAFEAWEDERRHRYEQRSRVTEAEAKRLPHQPHSAIVDEWVMTSDEVGKDAATAMRRTLYGGREARKHWILLAQDEGVEALNIKGRGGMRDGVVLVFLGGKAEKSVNPQINAELKAFADQIRDKEGKPKMRRPCVVLPPQGQGFCVDLDGDTIPMLARAAIRPGAIWTPAGETVSREIQTEQVRGEPSTEIEIPKATDPKSATFSADEVRVAAWIAAEPTISTREIARRLYPDSDGSGGPYKAAVKARERVAGVTKGVTQGVTVTVTETVTAENDGF